MTGLRHCLRHGDFLQAQRGGRCPSCVAEGKQTKLEAIIGWLRRSTTRRWT